MKGLWVTPEWEKHEVGDQEHATYAFQNKWTNRDKYNSQNYDETMALLNELYNNGYIRARYYEPSDLDEGDLVFQGVQRYMTPEIIEYVLDHYGLGKETPFTIETGDDQTLGHRVALSDWLNMYDKKLKPLTSQEIFMSRLKEPLENVKPVDKETQQRIISLIQGVGRG